MIKIYEADSLMEIAKLGKVGKYYISIFSGEGAIPHLHFYTNENDIKNGGAIRLDKAEYFPHGRNYTKKLNANDLDEFIQWLNSYSQEYKVLNYEITTYQNLCILWRQNNPDFIKLLPYNAEQPDYTKIK